MFRVLAIVMLMAASARADYAIVVARATHDDVEWGEVVAALQQKYDGTRVITYDKSPEQALPQLRAMFPKYACFVAKPTEATREFVAQVHQLTRKLDDDIYTDCLWGILTGYDAANALAIAKHREPLTIHKAASGTEIALDKLEQGVWYCELEQGKMVRKQAGEAPKQLEAPGDTTEALAQTLTDYKADLFVTSGHATERDWQIGYRYENGQFRSKAGQLFGADTNGRRFAVASPNPKVYMPIGNCLMGHIDGPDAMALAWMNSAGVKQMLGYTVLTWYGYAGWGVLDYFVEQPGRYSFAEAFHVNQHALVHRLSTNFPDAMDVELDAQGRPNRRIAMTPAAQKAGLTMQDATGLRFDRDVVAFYGDPAWEARLADGPRSYEQQLTVADGVYTLTIVPKLGERSFEPVNTNGAQRGWRPMVYLLPHRLKNVQVIDGADLEPVIADDFALVPNPRTCDPNRTYRVVFRAEERE